jgi:transcriptional regulator with XRE-family HTH domain
METKKDLLGEKLRQLRKKKNLTLDEFAKEMNEPYQHIASFERGRNGVSTEKKNKYFNFFGYAVEKKEVIKKIKNN